MKTKIKIASFTQLPIAQKIAASAIILIILLISIWTIWNLIAGAALRQAQETYKAKGLPTAIADVIPPPVAMERNAAGPLNQAMLLAAGGSTNSYNRIPKIEAVDAIWERIRKDPKAVSEITDQLSDPAIVEIIKLLREAADRPDCNWDNDYSSGSLRVNIPQLMSLRKSVGLLCLGAISHAKNSESDQAFALLNAAFQLSNHSKSEPQLTAYLIWASLLREVERTTNLVLNILPSSSVSIAQIAKVSEQIKDLEGSPAESLIKAFDAERILFSGQVFTEILTGTADPAMFSIEGETETSLPLRMYLWTISRPLQKADYTTLLERNLEFREIAARPMASLESDPVKHTTIPTTAVISRLVIPSLRILVEARHRLEAELAVYATGLALEEFRIENGEYPNSLSAITKLGTATIDPFTNKELRYNKTTKGFVLYSFGPNRKDDQATPKAKNKGNYDIVWEIDRS